MPETNTRSLGNLRTVDQPTTRHPRLLGQMKLQRHTLSYLVKQISEIQAAEVTCNLAGWVNRDGTGSFITIELSPKFVSKQRSTPVHSDPISQLFGGEADEPRSDQLEPQSQGWYQS
jgi:hypothetical protein